MARVVNTDGIPTILPDQRPPSDYQQIGADPSSFGGLIGASEQRVGSELTQASNELATAAIQKQDIYNETAGNQLYTKFQTHVNNLMYGDPDKPGDLGYFGLTGQAAMEARPVVQKQINDLIAQTAGEAPNAPVRNRFNDISRRLQSYTFQQMGSHYEKEMKVWGISTMQGAGLETQRSVANNYIDDEFFKHSLEDINGISVKSAQLAGTDPLAAMAEGQNKLISARIQGALAQNDYGAASQIFKEYSDKLDPTTRATIGTHLRAHATSAEGVSILNDARSGVTPSGGASSVQVPADLEPIGRAAAQKYNVPWDMFQHQIAGESGWNPNVAKSSAGAEGIAQFIPVTASQYGVNVKSPQSSLEGAAHYMSDLHAQGGTWESALTGYLTGTPGPEVKSVTAQNPEYAKAYAAARAADRGLDTGPAATPVPGAQLVSTTPGAASPPPPAPGLAQLAQVDAETAQNFGQTIARLEADPRRNTNPEAWQKAMQQAHTDYQMRHAALAGQMQALTVARAAAADELGRDIAANPTDASIADKINTNPALDFETRKNLTTFHNQQIQGTLAGEAKQFGSKYHDIIGHIGSGSDDPGRIYDPTQLIAIAARPALPDGTRELNDAGLTKALSLLKEAPTGIPKVQAGALAYARQKITGMSAGDDEIVKMAGIYSPKAEAKFLAFMPAFYNYWDDGIKAGKTPAQLVDSKALDPLIEQFTLSPSEVTQDRLLNGSSAAATPAPAIDLKSKEGIAAAFGAGHISRDEARKRLIEGGFFLTPTPAAPTPSAPLVH